MGGASKGYEEKGQGGFREEGCLPVLKRKEDFQWGDTEFKQQVWGYTVIAIVAEKVEETR